MKGIIKLLLYVLMIVLICALHMRVEDIGKRLDNDRRIIGGGTYTRTAINNL